jgi:hydroxymethylbilane synthase
MRRGDVRDAFISRSGLLLKDIPAGALVGTASLRRQAQVKRVRPDLEITLLRGNIETRLRKMNAGVVDAILLALVALERLNLRDQKREILDMTDFLPAVGQGAIALIMRENDSETRASAEFLIHEETTRAVNAERAFLDVLDGSCRTPIAGYAQIVEKRLTFHGVVFSPNGEKCWSITRSGPQENALEIARESGHILARERSEL